MPQSDPEYDQFAQGAQYWSRYEGAEYMLANGGPVEVPVGLNLRYAPHSESGDGYFRDHRHHLSKREQMRALELDPHHFFKVQPEPAAQHEQHQHYLSEFDADSDLGADRYYEDMIGYESEGRSYGDVSTLGFTSEGKDPNDILFNINEDLQFKLEAEDNYEGRDVDIGIVMPDGTTGGAKR